MSFFLVEPSSLCPHLHSDIHIRALSFALHPPTSCFLCSDDTECWVCLGCGIPACSRYVKGHMQQHRESSGVGHSICASFADLSVWCNSCECYVKHDCLTEILEY